MDINQPGRLRSRDLVWISVLLMFCVASVACRGTQRASSEATIIHGEFYDPEFSPSAMAECAAIYGVFEFERMSGMAGAAAAKAGQSRYGWTEVEAQSQIEDYRETFTWNPPTDSMIKACDHNLHQMSLIASGRLSAE